MQLNPSQKQAVTQCSQPTLVLAGAGSGKTGVITKKIAWIIEQELAPASSIVAVTFTNKAAAEMQQRLTKIVGAKICRKLSISTFHRFGLRMLQSQGSELGLKKGFTILDQTDCLNAVQEIIREGNLPHDEKILLGTISQWKNDMVEPAEAMQQAENEYNLAAAQVYARYRALLEACNSVDFDDLIFYPVKLLRESTAVQEKWHQRLQHLLVDEYQDTNASQYELVRLLLGKQGILTAVGDDDQSIYSWRGANPENLGRLKQDFPDLAIVKLEQNYRSSQRILRAANAVIAENPHMFEKQLWSDLGIGDPLRLNACKNSIDEAEWVAADILTQQFRFNTKPGDIAILYRSNFQARPLEQALREKHIPYRISGGQSFFDRAEIKDVMAYLKVMINHDDDTSFLRIINTPKREFGAKTIENLALFAREAGCSLFTACMESGLQQRLPARVTQKLDGFANWMVLMADNANRGDAVAVVRELLEEIEYDSHLESVAATPASFERATQNVEELLLWIERLCNEEPADALEPSANDAREFSDIVAHIALMDILSRQDDSGDEEQNSQVQLMTLHAAKGLEFPYVYIIGMEEGVLPHHASSDDKSIEEERRLAYVGMTRARFKLTFTWARTRQRFGETSANEPSRFLDAISQEDLIRLGDPSSSQADERNAATGKATLDSLKSLLEG